MEGTFHRFYNVHVYIYIGIKGQLQVQIKLFYCRLNKHWQEYICSFWEKKGLIIIKILKYPEIHNSESVSTYYDHLCLIFVCLTNMYKCTSMYTKYKSYNHNKHWTIKWSNKKSFNMLKMKINLLYYNCNVL